MIDLSNRQKKWAAAGVTSLAVALVVAFALGIGWFVLKLLNLTAPALTPVIMGLLLSMFFKPYYGWFLKRLHNPTLALVTMSLTVLVPAGLVLWLTGAMLIEQLSAFITAAPTIVTRASEWFQAQHPGLHAGLVKLGVPDSALLFFTDPAQFSHDILSQLGAQYGGKAVKVSFSVVKYLMGLVGWIVTMIFFVYFLMKPALRGEDCVRQMPFLKEETRNFVATQIDAFIDILVSFFQRQTVICLIEGMMYGTGFWLVGLPYGFLIGFTLGVLNLIPLFGSLVCLPVALPLAYFVHGGSLTRLVLVLVVWGLGQFLDGYLITPRIQGDRTGLGYAGVIFSFFFWGTLLGPMLGMLLAIPLSAFCVVLWRALTATYIRPVV